MRSFDRAMPEELNRVLTDHASDAAAVLVGGRGREPAPRVGRRRGRARRRRDGRRRRRCPAGGARDAPTLSRAYGVDAGEYLLADRPPRRQRRRSRRGCARWSSCSPRCPMPVVLPLHPRTRGAAAATPGCTSRSSARQRASSPPPLGYLEFSALLCQRARRADRLGRRPEGGLPCRGAVRDAASRAPSGSRRSRPAGTCSSTSTPPRRSRRSSATPPARAPAALRRRPRRRARASRRLHCAAHEASAMSDSPLRVGVAGLGYWGPNLARNFAAIPGCELTLVLRRLARPRASGSRRRSRARARPPSSDELLADAELDAVVLATPVPTHAELADRGARGRQALLRREAAGAVGRRRRARGRRRRREPGGC